MNERYADVVVDISHEKLDRSFQYRIPPELAGKIRAGSRVWIPFGNGNRLIEGYVIGLGDAPKFEPGRLKSVAGLVEGGTNVEARLIALAAWMRETYGSTMIQALKTVLPVKEKKQPRAERRILLQADPRQAEAWLALFQKKHNTARERLLRRLMETPELDYREAAGTLKVTAAVIRSMEEQGILRVEQKTGGETAGAEGSREDPRQAEILTAGQQEVLGDILQEWEGRGRPCLIHGVTGSGKTLVYMELIRKVLEKEGQAIVLIPEIALTWQTVNRFYRRFGNQVAVLHSRLTPAQRFAQTERVRTGKASIMVGPRSALFTPFSRLKLIVVDEEHEGSYQSEGTPRYHARETALERAKLEGAHVVLGSATPSVEARYACEKGDWALFTLKERYGGAVLPEVRVADMRRELREGNRSVFSRELQRELALCLNRGEQAMLFLNRRGYAGFVACRSCGHVIKCPHCDVSLTYHSSGQLVCHYCGYVTEQADRCPVCGSSYIGGFRAGTQQVEQAVKKMFPKARTLRMDADTTRGKDGYEKILRAFSRGEADVLIGTQMIVKGHDFPGVTLVGAVMADVSLFAGDYRAPERTYQILVQAAGRAGRGSRPGTAVIQTYQPEHYSIRAAAEQDYESFYQEEIRFRQLMGYPPACGLLAVHGSCGQEELLGEAMEYIRKYLIRVRRDRRVQLIGPAPESISKIQDLYRQVLYVKGPDKKALIRIREKLEKYIEINSGFKNVYIQYDFNA